MLDLRLELGNVTKYEDGGIKRIDLQTSTYEKDFLSGDYSKETYFARSGEISVSTTQSLHHLNIIATQTHPIATTSIHPFPSGLHLPGRRVSLLRNNT
jgi:hypothetical protein